MTKSIKEIKETLCNNMGFEDIMRFNDGGDNCYDEDNCDHCYLQSSDIPDDTLKNLLVKAKYAIDAVYEYLEGLEG